MQIFLIGFMGSGKSYCGKLWAANSDFSFIDLDAVIEKNEDTTIAKIFEEKGETYFRELESTTLHSLHNQQNTIIACGGGTPCFHNNMQWMNANGTTVYLKGTPQLLAQRVLNEKQQRPILSNIKDEELEDFIEKKLTERELFYNQAKVILDAGNVTNETFKMILGFNDKT
jgi:shikimate kinase